ncbi:DUF4489 domain-containing protein [Wukongibacter baidiensis]|uniref:DUF4489 domain-containing protein n=1 Tax=Wukongibacter baidiensis TaxID=1723361 RepID=UPI003D7FEF00
MSRDPRCSDYDRNYKRKNCDNRKEEVIIIKKDNDFKKKCGCSPCKTHPNQRGVILACGNQNNTININNNIPIPAPTVEIARVTIDPSVLFNPLVIIEFCSIIFSPSLISTELTFALSKECENITKKVVKKVVYKRPDSLGASEDSFCFKFCDFENNCIGGSCSYIVELVEATVSSTGSTISQGVITAEVQGSCVDC